LYADNEISDDEDEAAPGQPYPSGLPLPVTSNVPTKHTKPSSSNQTRGNNGVGNVWDARMFDIGDDDSDEDENRRLSTK
jgi:hypothetical protein